jgi:regulator of sirC expression with transglutaminase-like and TPR domain
MSVSQREIEAMIALFDDDDEIFFAVKKDMTEKYGKDALPVLLAAAQKNAPTSALLLHRIHMTLAEIRKNTLSEGLKNWIENGAKDLAEGLFYLALLENPALTLENLQQKLDDLTFEAWKHYKYAFTPTEQIQNLNRIFFQEMRFKPNINHFHLPENSMIDSILEKRTSNPIGLCIAYMHIAQSLRFPVFGVNLPNLFVLTYKSPQSCFYINVFNLGIIFSRTDIENYLLQMRLEPHDAFFEPCQNSVIVKRVMNNLLAAYEKTAEVEKFNDLTKLIKHIA